MRVPDGWSDQAAAKIAAVPQSDIASAKVGPKRRSEYRKGDHRLSKPRPFAPKAMVVICLT